VKLEKEGPRRKKLSDPDIEELERRRNMKLSDAKLICDYGSEIRLLREDGKMLNLLSLPQG
jgi:hypothetical protein